MAEPAAPAELARAAQLDSPDFYADNPHPVFAWLRAEAPVYWYAPGAFWAVTRHEDVATVSKDHATYSVAQGTRLRDRHGSRHFVSGAKPLFQTDPPEHTRYRTMINKAFTPRRVRELEVDIRAQVRRMLGDLPDGEVDFVTAFAEPLPIWVIAGILGLPRDDWEQFKHWSDVRVRELDARPGTEEDRAIQEELAHYFDYLDRALEVRRRSPEDDLISVIAAQDLSRPNQIQMVNSIVVAGNETTRSALSCAADTLARRPDQWQQLVAAGADGSVDATEEVLRWATPVVNFGRTVTRDTELAGVPLAEGDYVAMFYISANRDERVWEDADQFDVARKAEPHTTFGTGVHFCAGAPLARLELRITVEELVSTFRSIAPAGESQRVASVQVNQYSHVPVALTRGHG